MSEEICARMLQQGDPDRWRAAMAAPPALRGPLSGLWAANLEIARAAWASREAALCEIRLQWWDDALAALGRGDAPERHPALQSLAQHPDGQIIAALREIVAARRADLQAEPFTDEAALLRYLDQTGGALAEAGARICAAYAPRRLARDAGRGGHHARPKAGRGGKGPDVPSVEETAAVRGGGIARGSGDQAGNAPGALPDVEGGDAPRHVPGAGAGTLPDGEPGDGPLDGIGRLPARAGPGVGPEMGRQDTSLGPGLQAMRAHGAAAAMARYLQGVAALKHRGRRPLPDDSPGAIASLARDALARLRESRSRLPRACYPASRAEWQAARLLRLAAATPSAVMDGALHIPEFTKRLSLLLRVALGRP